MPRAATTSSLPAPGCSMRWCKMQREESRALDPSGARPALGRHAAAQVLRWYGIEIPSERLPSAIDRALSAGADAACGTDDAQILAADVAEQVAGQLREHGLSARAIELDAARLDALRVPTVLVLGSGAAV